jgi:hypothetical protein
MFFRFPRPEEQKDEHIVLAGGSRGALHQCAIPAEDADANPGSRAAAGGAVDSSAAIGEQRIVGEDGADAYKDGIAFMALLLHVGAGLLRR